MVGFPGEVTIGELGVLMIGGVVSSVWGGSVAVPSGGVSLAEPPSRQHGCVVLWLVLCH